MDFTGIIIPFVTGRVELPPKNKIQPTWDPNVFPPKIFKKIQSWKPSKQKSYSKVEDASTLVLLGHPPVFHTSGCALLHILTGFLRTTFGNLATLPLTTQAAGEDPTRPQVFFEKNPSPSGVIDAKKMVRSTKWVLLRELTYPTKREVRKIIIFKSDFWWDMLVFRSVVQKYYLGVCHPRKPHGDIITSMVKKFPMPQSAPL